MIFGNCFYVQSQLPNPKPQDDHSFLTKEQLRQRLNLPSTRMIDGMMKKRMIPYLKWGSKTVRFDFEKVTAALEKFELKAVGQK